MTTNELAVRAAPRALAGRAVVLWRFSRPHTVIGTVISVLGLAVIAGDAGHTPSVADVLAVLAAALCVNVAIVGLNQIEDVEIDRVNKPDLPIAAGHLSMSAARAIVAATAVAPVVMALTQGPVETAAVLVALAVGAAYSSPPLRLKRQPALAALSITGVRALIVNLGVYGHFAGGSLTEVPGPVWALALFVLPFSFAIALLKDVPDIEGDRRFRISTFSVRLGPRRVMRIALAALTAAYAGMALVGPLALHEANAPMLIISHLLALAVLWRWATRVDPEQREPFTQFYMRVWQLFFLEYALVPLSVVA